MMVRSYFIMVLLMCPTLGVSQSNDSTQTQPSQASYIESFNNYLLVKSSIKNDIEIFEVNSTPNTFTLVPNAAAYTHLLINYRFISLGVGVSPRFLPGNNDDSRRGRTTIRSYRLNLQIGHWIQSVAYQGINGFYLQNTIDYIPNWNRRTDDYIQFPDLKFSGVFGLTGYKFNPNFSLKSLSTQTERQLKSAGTFVLLAWYRYYVMDNQVELTGQNSSQKSNNLEGIMQLGYSYIHAFNKKFYVSPSVALGGGLIRTRLLTRLPAGEIYTNNTEPIIRAEGQFAAGYNAKRVFAGLQVIGRYDRYNQGGSTSAIINEAITYQIFFGYRFHAPEFLRRQVNKVPFVN